MEVVVTFSVFLLITLTVYFSVIYFLDNFVISMKLSNINIISYNFYMQLGVFCLLGSVLFISGVVSEDTFFKETSLYSRIHAFTALITSTILFSLFMWLYTKLFSNLSIPKITSSSEFDVRSMSIFLYMIVLLDILLCIYIYFGLNEIPLVELLSGDIKKAAILRIQNAESFEGVNAIYNVFAKYYIPSVALVLFFVHKIMSYPCKWLYRLSVILAVLFLLHDTQKAPILDFILTIILIQIFVNGFKKKYLIYVLYIIIASVLLYSFAKGIGFDQIEYLFYRVGRRIFISQIGGLFLSFEYFPAFETFQYTLQGAPEILLNILGLEDINSAKDIMIRLEGNALELGVMNSHYMSGAWASYGYLGFILGPLIVSLNYFMIHKLLFAYKRYLFIGIPLYFLFVVKLVFTADFKLFAFFTCLIIPIVFYFGFIFAHITSNFIYNIIKSKY